MNVIIPSGDIMLDGKVTGKHDGIPFYTIGQRSGIGAHGQRVYVSEIDEKNNIVKIGREADLHHKGLIAGNVNFISVGSLDGNVRVQAMVRYKGTLAPAIASADGDGKIRVDFDEPKRAITPGQSLVMYDGDKLLGGGIIEKIVE
jgi:tRNA-specific 2-thiouridylase